MSSRANLHDALDRQAFDHAVLCTFTFDLRFFEGYCLDGLKALSENRNITVIVDRRTYDSLISAPPSEWPRLANIRYLLHPIAVQGTFHPKLFLLVGKDKGMLIVGSANLTKAGLTANAELVGLYRFERGKQEQHIGLFRQAVQFLMELGDRWPSEDLGSNLRELIRGADWLDPRNSPAEGPLHLVHNLDGPLWPKMCEGINPPVDSVHVLSRYFDQEASALTRVQEQVQPRRIVLWTQNGITTLTPVWFQHRSVKDGVATVRDCTVHDDGHPQPLHAKGLAFIKGKSVRLAFGSANFTRAGMFSSADEGNVEVMVVADGLSLSTCNPKNLFDPCGSAQDLTDPGLLRSAPRDQRRRRPALPVELSEASLGDRHLRCRCTLPAEKASSSQVTAILTFSDGGEICQRLEWDGTAFVGTIDEGAERRCRMGTTMISIKCVVDGNKSIFSNRSMLVNLRDMDSGRGQRRERRVREAEQSAAQFAAILEELLQVGETEALKTFLTHCNIPLVNAARPFSGRGARPQWQGEAALRKLGEGNLREYATLHEAAMGFCNRHVRKMRRHCECASVVGIPNFMHIALAVSSVLEAQVERLLVGLEATELPLTAQAWYDHRQRLGEYLKTFGEAAGLLKNEYLPALESHFNAVAIEEAFRPDLKPLRDVCAAFLRVQKRVEDGRATKLRVLTQTGDLVRPPVYSSDLLSPGSWTVWSRVVSSVQERCNEWAGATE